MLRGIRVLLLLAVCLLALYFNSYGQSSCTPTVQITNVSCFGGNNGTITVTATSCGSSGNGCFSGTVAPVQNCTNCNSSIQGEVNLTVNPGEKICVQAASSITGGVTLNGGSLVVCGNANLNYLNLNNNSTVVILGSAIISAINFNSSTAKLYNYGTVTFSNNLPVAGEFYNYGNTIVNSDLSINDGSGKVFNNNTLTVKGNLNNNEVLENRGTLVVGTNTSQKIQLNSTSQTLNTCSISVSGELIIDASSTLDHQGILTVGTNLTLNGNSLLKIQGGKKIITLHFTGNTAKVQRVGGTGCSLLKVTSQTLFNSGFTVDGNISYCDANGIETNNGAKFINGAGINCTCNPPAPSSGGPVPVVMMWPELGATGPTVTGLVAGTYTLKITCGTCVSTTTHVVTQPPILTATATPHSNGSVTLVVNGGTPAYTYQWRNNGTVVSTQQNPTNLPLGMNIITVTDSKGCTAKDTAEIFIDCTPTVSVTPISCFGKADGKITVSGTLCSSPIITWPELGTSGSQVSNLGAGSYTVKVTCPTCVSTTIHQLVEPPLLTASATTNSDGSVNLLVTGGSPVYTYKWEQNGVLVSTLANPVNLPAGLTIITITDSKGCTVQTSVTISKTVCPGNDPEVSIKNETCPGAKDGSIKVTVSNNFCPGGNRNSKCFTGPAVPPVTNCNNCTSYTGGNISSGQNCISGNYNGTISMTGGRLVICGTAVATGVTLAGNAELIILGSFQGSNMNFNSSTVKVANYGNIQINGSEPIGGTFDNYGTATVIGDWNINSGGPLIVFNNYGSLQVNGSFNNGKNFNNYGTININNQFQQNSGGIFNNYCSMTVHGNILINADLHNEGKLLNHFAGSQSTLNGSGKLFMEGGLLETTQLQVNASISGVNNTCSVLRYESRVVNSGGSIATNVEQCLYGSNCSCTTAGNGLITGGGGSSPAPTYVWTGPGVNGRTGSQIENLSPGDYTVTISCGSCELKRTYTVESSGAIEITTIGTPVSCDQAFDGSIRADVSGGSGNYTYQWSDGFKVIGSTSQIKNLLAGNYSVIVTDQTNAFCHSSKDFTLSLKGTPCPCGEISIEIKGQGPSCNGGGSDGFLEAIGHGGGPFTFKWNTGATTSRINNLAAGWYAVTVKNQSGDSCNRIAFLPKSASFKVDIIPSKTSACPGENIILQAVTSAAIERYEWSNGNSSGPTLVVNNPGTYSVTAIDAAGCESSASINIIPNNACPQCTLDIHLTPTNISCHGLNDGKVQVSISGGSGDYLFAWNNGGTSQTLTNLQPGSYTLSVTDIQTGAVCTNNNATINEPAPLQVSISGNLFLCGAGSTVLTAIGTPGVYRWINRSETTQSITVSQEGTYQVEVRNANGTCPSLSNIATVLKQPQQVQIYANQVKICEGDKITLVSSYPTNNVWSTGAVSRSIEVSEPGTYTLEVQLGNCSAVDASVTIETAAPELCKSKPCEPQYMVPVDLGNPCSQMALDLARHNAQVRYTRYLDEQKRGFQQRYIAKCLQNQENYTLNYQEREHHYTLYYYNQAGNLVRTVPPQGVKIITSPTTLANIRTERRNNQRTIETEHDYASTYTYNSGNNTIAQKLPDHGTHAGDTISSRFWYDELGRLVLSQNARQFHQNPKRYSYTLYDAFNRIVEGGEIRVDVNLDTLQKSDNASQLISSKLQLFLAAQVKHEVVRNHYDESLFAGIGISQENLRNRIASSTYTILDSDTNVATYDHATHYSYDIHGHIKTIVQDNPSLDHLSDQRYKRIDYVYDLISRDILEIHYQKGKADQFFHRNIYDADNRLSVVETSTDYINWDRDAKQFYYEHGPLSRIELGHEKIQGMDYAHTMHDWIKGVNSNTLKPDRDMGKDGNNSGLHQMIAQDEIGYSLGYYQGIDSLGNRQEDYKAISNPSTGNNFLSNLDDSDLEVQNKNLFNGNVSHMLTSIKSFMQNNEGPLAMSFRYDQLNRLKESRVYQDPGVQNNNDWAANGTSTDKYAMKLAYDANGNIISLKRNAQAATTSAADGLDNLNYIYENKANGYSTNTNKLVAVQDAHNHTGNVALAGIDDIEQGQTFNSSNRTNDNYQYDEEGRLVADLSEGIVNIEWNNLGKIAKVERSDTSKASDLEFAYDAQGRRIMKLIKPRNGTNLLSQDNWIYTYYIPDGQGNIMAVYERRFNSQASGNYREHYVLTEQHLFSGDRLGYHKPQNGELITRDFTATLGSDKLFSNIQETGVLVSSLNADSLSVFRGNKSYELQNNLNNVLTVVSDRRIPTTIDNSTISGYNAQMRSATDYYPFGMVLPGRNIVNDNTYRYGFNGMEKDNELKGNGNSYDFGARIYDPRLGRWLSVDPLSSKYPSNSPYQYSLNSPIVLSDPDGKAARYTVFRNKAGGGDILISATIYIVGEKANVEIAQKLNETLHERLKPGTYVDDRTGEKFNISFNVEVLYDPELSAHGYKGDTRDKNLMKLKQTGFIDSDVRSSARVEGSSKITESWWDYTFYTDEFEGTVAHETLHLLGLYDRYWENDPKKSDKNKTHTSISRHGLEDDIMMNQKNEEINQLHYNNFGRYILEQTGMRANAQKKFGSGYINQGYIDLDEKGQLIGQGLTKEQEKERRTAIGAGIAAEKSSRAGALKRELERQKKELEEMRKRTPAIMEPGF